MDFYKDLRYGVRGLASHPGFTVVAVTSLALGIGLNTTIFSLVNAVLLRPAPVERPQELVRIYASKPEEAERYSTSSYLDYLDLRTGTTCSRDWRHTRSCWRASRKTASPS